MSVRSRNLRRELARLRTSTLRQDENQPSALHWPNVANLQNEWRTLCEKTIREMKVCGNCGFVSYGNTADYKFRVVTVVPPTVAPYVLCNAFLLRYIHVDNAHYNICLPCIKDNSRKKLLSFMSPSYIRGILKARPLYMQLLSLVDCRIGIINKFNGFHSGFVRSESILESPLICWNLDTLECRNLPIIMIEVYDIFATNLVINKLFKQYLCLLETPDPSLGMCIVNSDAVHTILAHQREKGIATHSMSVNPYDGDIQILQDVSYAIPVTRKRKYDLYDSGNLHCRNALLPRESFRTNVEGLSSNKDITLETTMFPFLFPHQQGHYSGGLRYSDYIRRRAQQLFSPFTLYKPYLLLSYELRQSIQLATMTKTCFLDKEYSELKRTKPDLCEEEIFRLLIKQKISYNVPGSPAWHSHHLKDLVCMVQHWGLPSFFLTLTCDEVSDTRWCEINDLEKLVKSMNKDATWKDCAVECAVLFHTRLQTFLRKYIFCGENGILGKIDHYVIHYELQGRASLHAHIPMWCHARDIDRVTNEICAYVPAPFDLSSGKFQEPIEPSQKLLYRYVTSKQMHRCKEGACIKKDTNTEVKYCKMGFPHEVHAEKTPSIHATSGKWQYFRPSLEHRNVVPYHPVILLLWGAHMNIQRVTNEAWSFYLLKYALKCEPTGFLDLNMENAKALGLQDLSDTQLKLVSSAVLCRPVAATEAALTCLQISTIHRSDTVSFVDSSPPNRQTSLYRKTSTVCLHPTQVYSLRPISLSNLTFYEYFQNYEILKVKNNNKGFIDLDFRGYYVYSTTRLVRFSDYHPVYHFDQFFYNILLQKISFRSESELLLRSDVSWTYFHECVNRKFITCNEDIEQLIDLYGNNHLYSSVYKGELMDKMRNRIPPTIWTEALHGQYTCPILLSRNIIENQSSSIEDSSTPLITLTIDQESVFNELRTKSYGLYMINGSPGTGKSFFISFLKQFWEEQGKKVLLTATTAVAAIRLHKSATTVHRTFKIPIRGALPRLHRTSEVFDLLSAADVIIIDECSMLTPYILISVLSRLHEVLQGENQKKNPLSIKLVILVGNMCQLPPVCTHEAKPVCLQCHLSGSPLYTTMHKYQLTTVMRQASDPEFKAFLNSIRIKNPSNTLIDNCLQCCYVSEDDGYRFIDKETTIICSHRDSVTRYNTYCLLNFFSPNHIVEVQVQTNAPDGPEHNKWIASSKFHQLTHVAIGCKVLLTENIDIGKQAANGSIGEVFDLLYNEGELCTIVVKLDINGNLINVGRSQSQYMRPRGVTTYQKSTFPLMLGYAMTGHKSQGCTLSNKVLVVLNSAFAAGLTYVMLSRVTNRTNLRIVGKLVSDDFTVFRET